MKTIRIRQGHTYPTGLITDETGELVDGVVAATVRLDPCSRPTAQLHVFVAEVDVEVAATDVTWHGLDLVPAAALQAELVRRGERP